MRGQEGDALLCVAHSHSLFVLLQVALEVETPTQISLVEEASGEVSEASGGIPRTLFGRLCVERTAQKPAMFTAGTLKTVF